MVLEPVEYFVDVIFVHACNDVAPPQPDVEVGMFRAEKAREPQRTLARAPERPQKERLPAGVESGDDAGLNARAFSHMALPGGEQVEALIGGGKRSARFEPTPGGLRRRQRIESLDLACPERLMSWRA